MAHFPNGFSSPAVLLLLLTVCLLGMTVQPTQSQYLEFPPRGIGYQRPPPKYPWPPQSLSPQISVTTEGGASIAGVIPVVCGPCFAPRGNRCVFQRPLCPVRIGNPAGREIQDQDD